MGLQGQLNDMSSDSLPILLLAVVATFVSHLRSSLHSLLPSRRRRHPSSDEDTSLFANLAEQLNLNTLLSYTHRRHHHRDGVIHDYCIVCLSCFKDGERVRALECRHVFHKKCFDGWLEQVNFTCPICRAPLVYEERVDHKRRRVGGELVNWFSLRAN